MRKIDKYISKEKMCNLVANRAEKLFELSSEESNYLRNRLKKYDKMELQHLYHNFTSFGVDAVLECICENEKLKHQNKKQAGTIPQCQLLFLRHPLNQNNHLVHKMMACKDL